MSGKTRLPLFAMAMVSERLMGRLLCRRPEPEICRQRLVEAFVVPPVLFSESLLPALFSFPQPCFLAAVPLWLELRCHSWCNAWQSCFLDIHSFCRPPGYAWAVSLYFWHAAPSLPVLATSAAQLLKASLLALSNLPVSALIVAAFDSKQQKKVKIMIKADFMISSRGIVKIVYNFNMT